MLEFAKYEMYCKALAAFGELGEDEELGPADWNTIRKYVSCLSYEENKPTHPHEPLSFALPDGEHTKQQMADTRIRFLNGKSVCTLLEFVCYVWSKKMKSCIYLCTSSVSSSLMSSFISSAK